MPCLPVASVRLRLSRASLSTAVSGAAQSSPSTSATRSVSGLLVRSSCFQPSRSVSTPSTHSTLRSLSDTHRLPTVSSTGMGVKTPRKSRSSLMPDRRDTVRPMGSTCVGRAHVQVAAERARSRTPAVSPSTQRVSTPVPPIQAHPGPLRASLATHLLGAVEHHVLQVLVDEPLLARGDVVAHQLGMHLGQRRGHEHAHALAHELRALVAKHVAQRRVGVHDDGLRVFAIAQGEARKKMFVRLGSTRRQSPRTSEREPAR